MASGWYGSVHNRLEENRQFCDEIKVGTGCTIYHWSDRDAYEVIEVKDPKHIVIRELAHTKREGAEWCENDWILTSDETKPEMELVKRGKYWYSVTTATPELAMRAIKAQEAGDSERIVWFALNGWNAREIAESGKARHKYYRQNISFGKASYYYDYEF